MRRTVTVTRSFDTRVLLVAMTPAQVREWKWVGDEWQGEDPVMGWWVRDVTGALLGAVLPLGHKASRIHAEYFDPQADDFFFAGVTNAPVLTQGVSRVLSNYRYQVGPVPQGEGFTFGRRLNIDCMYSRCAVGCPDCARRDQPREVPAPAAIPAPRPASLPVQMELTAA